MFSAVFYLWCSIHSNHTSISALASNGWRGDGAMVGNGDLGMCGVVQQLTKLVQPNVYLDIQHEHKKNDKTRVFIPRTTRARIECSRTGYTK